MKLNVSPDLLISEEADVPFKADYTIDTLKLCPCGRMFTPYRPYQRFCCDSHRVKYSQGKKSSYIKHKTFKVICKECGAEFITNDTKRHYCKPECYNAFQLKRRAESETRHCLICGQAFTTTHWLKRYCSDDCRRQAHAISRS